MKFTKLSIQVKAWASKHAANFLLYCIGASFVIGSLTYSYATLRDDNLDLCVNLPEQTPIL